MVVLIVIMIIIYKLIDQLIPKKKKYIKSLPGKWSKPHPLTTYITGIDPYKNNNGCSKAEYKIKQYLDLQNIIYDQEYTFRDLVNPDTNNLLRFDFYLPYLNVCIEYDGKQHFQYVPSVHGPDKSIGLIQVEKQKRLDELKNKYCSTKGIKLIRLNSSHYYRINEVLNTRLK